jgi:hypothetical protein
VGRGSKDPAAESSLHHREELKLERIDIELPEELFLQRQRFAALVERLIGFAKSLLEALEILAALPAIDGGVVTIGPAQELGAAVSGRLAKQCGPFALRPIVRFEPRPGVRPYAIGSEDGDHAGGERRA